MIRSQCGKIDLHKEKTWHLPYFSLTGREKGESVDCYFIRIKDSCVGKWTYFEKFGTGHA